VWDTDPAVTFETEVFERLVRAGAVFRSGDGQVGLGPPMIRLVDYLDHRLRALAVRELGAIEHRYPTLIPAEVVERSGYLESFPHMVLFVTHPHGERTDDAGFSGRPLRGHCLPPTVCLHTYHWYAGTTIEPDPVTVVTSLGKAFRLEEPAGLERLWDFTIREVVFLGEPEMVRALRRSAMNLAHGLVEELGLSGYTEVASDPFFTVPDGAERELAQLVTESKYELRLRLGGKRSVAAGSFNHAGHLFARRFAISFPDGRAVTSGCAGFGLERWAYAFACRHGIDERLWPEEVRRWGRSATV
jgi:seryl-tRNA synthetase